MNQGIDFAELKASCALPSPQGVGLAVIRLCQRENVPLAEVAKQIQADPVLAGRIIKIANLTSRNQTRPIASVTIEVLILIGIHAVRQVVLGISLVAAHRQGGCGAFDYEQFWARSVAMACATQMLGTVIHVAPVAELFTCGLVAGIGRLGLATARPQAYSRLLEEYADKPQRELTAAETSLFHFNHLSLAAAMMLDWNIPRLFSDAVLFHEDPQTSPFPEGARQQRLALMLHMAARIADVCVAQDAARECLIPSLYETGAAVGLDAEQVADVVAAAARDWLEWGNVMQVQTRALPPLPRMPAN